MTKFDTDHLITVNISGTHDNGRGAILSLGNASCRTVDRERERVIAASRALQERDNAAVRATAMAGGVIDFDAIPQTELPHSLFIAETASYQHCESTRPSPTFFQVCFGLTPAVRREVSIRERVTGYRIKPAILEEMKRQAEAKARESEKRLTVAQIAAVMCELERRTERTRKPSKGRRRVPFKLSAPDVIRAKAEAFTAAANDLFPVAPQA